MTSPMSADVHVACGTVNVVPADADAGTSVVIHPAYSGDDGAFAIDEAKAEPGTKARRIDVKTTAGAAILRLIRFVMVSFR